MVRGFFIFVVFICKQSVWQLAKKEYPRLTGFFANTKTKEKSKSKSRKYEAFQMEIIAKEQNNVGAHIDQERLI